MFTFRKAKRIFEKIRKPDRSKKGENALQRIRNMLDKYETPITLALLFLWDDYNIDEETTDEVMSGNESVEDVHAPFESNLRDFEDETLTPTLEQVGEERFETAYEDNKDSIPKHQMMITKIMKIVSLIILHFTPNGVMKERVILLQISMIHREKMLKAL